MNQDDAAPPLVEIWRAWGDFEVQFIRGLLEANGIESAFRGESTRVTHALTLDGLAEVKILVHESDAARACELIAGADGMTACPHCGKPASEKDTACRFCSEPLTGTSP
jgi:hypothetical protein